MIPTSTAGDIYADYEMNKTRNANSVRLLNDYFVREYHAVKYRMRLHMALSGSGSEPIPERKYFVKWLLGLALEEYKTGVDISIQGIAAHLRAQDLQSAYQQLIDVSLHTHYF